MTALDDRWSDSIASLRHAPAPGWLQALRQAAAANFRETGLPHRKIEAWKYTPLKALEAFEALPGGEAPRVSAGLPPPVCERAAVADVVDGRLQAELPRVPQGVTLLPLDQGIAKFEDRLKALFEGVALDGSTHAFAALNTACAEQGLVVHVASGVNAGRLLVRWAFAAGGTPSIRHFRLFLLLESGASLDIVEQYQSMTAAAQGLNVLGQAELGEGARLDHTRVQVESDQAFLLTSTTVQQAADSVYRYCGFDLGANLARHEITALLSGPRASADISGAFVLDGRRHADNHVNVEHRAPACRSEQLFRGVLGGRSRGVFNGRALIQPGADGSSVRQSNANLLLSELAEMDTKPELEIYADEVEASHGATVGQLDEAAVFYLRSRGLSESQARRMLTTAFCHAVSDRLTDRELATRIGALMDAAMPGDGGA